jgi:predicted phosphatase
VQNRNVTLLKCKKNCHETMVELSWNINKVTRVSIGNMFTLLRNFALIVLTFHFVKKKLMMKLKFIGKYHHWFLNQQK